MSEDCGCVKTFDGAGNPTTSSLVTYNGASLCTGLSSGTINDILASIAEYNCISRNLIDTLTLSDAEITLTDIGPDCITSQLGSNPTLHDLWVLQNTMLCSVATSLTNLDSGDVKLEAITWTPFTNCPSITTGESLTTSIRKIVGYFCENMVVLSNFFVGGVLQSPLNSYSKGVVTIVDSSAGGQAKVDVSAQNYWADGNNITRAGKTIELIDSADNYIYLDNTNSFAYAVSAVGIGAAAPTTNGVKCFKITTGVGTIVGSTGGIVHLLPITPIGTTLLADDSVTAAKLNADVVYTGGGLKQETAGALSVYVDGVGIEVSSSKIALKDDGVTKAKLASDVVSATGGLKQETDGSLSAKPDLTSIGLDSSYQLRGLQIAPGAGTNSIRQYGLAGTAAGTGAASLNIGTATNDYSTAVNGASTKANYSFGSAVGRSIHKYSRVIGSPAQVSFGSNQKIEVEVTGLTADATPAILTIDGTDKLVIPTDSAVRFKIEVMASQTAGSAGTAGDSLCQSFEGLIKNVSGTCALVSTVVNGTPINDGAFGGSVAVTANNTTKTLDITVTGEANKTINWTADVTMVMTGFNLFTI